MKKLCLSICLLVIFALPAFAQTNQKTEIRGIDVYSRRLDAFAKKRPKSKLIFADTSQNEKPDWRKFESEAALEKFRETSETYTIALVWRERGRVVNAVFTLFSESGDWAQYDSHYFRPDGRAAKISSELRTFNGSLIILRDFYFDRRGKLLRKTARYLDLNTKKPVKKPTGDYFTNETEIYKTTKQLPFARLLK